MFTVILAAICGILAAVCSGIMLWVEYGVWAIAVYASMFLALPVSGFLHECGHMLFGATVKIKAVPHFSLFGSSCCKIIPKTDKNLRRRVFFTASGGLAVNALLAVLGLIAVFVPSVPLWLCLFMPSSCYLFILNFDASMLGNGKTDGLVMDELLQNTDSAKVMIAVLTVQAQLLGGKRIEDVDESLLFGLPQIREDDMSFISLTELRYEYFKAKGDADNAEKYRSRLEDLRQYL